MIVKTKKVRIERYWKSFLLILSLSIIIIYFIFNNDSIKIKTIIPFGHNWFLYLFDIKIYFSIILLMFNFGNTYQVLLLFYSLIIPQFIKSIDFLFLGFIKQNDMNALFHDYFLFIFFFLVLGKTLFDVNEKNANNNKKGIVLYVIVFLFLLFCLSNTIAILNYSKIIYLNKIISAFLVAFSFCFFIFHVLNANYNDSMQLFYFINSINNSIITVFFYIMIIISIFLNHTNNCFNLSYTLLYIISLIIPIYGIIYEYKFIFNSNRKNWINFNFEKEPNDKEMNILISEITITKSIKWNQTSIIIDLLRLIVLFVIKAGIFYCSDNLYNNKNDAFLLFAFSIFIFIIDKILLYWVRLINMTYFFLEGNSINSR
jgi:hypothetical protein